MSLSGKLEIFPLEEVLRLLARSHQSGCLRVEGPGAGRIYLDNGSLTYASVEPDDTLRAHLLAAGVVTETGLSQVDLSNGSLTEALAPGVSSAALGDVIREQCTESLYRIRRPQSGPFSFSVDSRPRYATGQSYDVEMIISEADRRATEWADIEEVVPDLTTSWRMVPEIEEESVKLSDVAWRFLAALEGTSSVKSLAQRLGLTDFQAARRMAELSRARLVENSIAGDGAGAAPQSTYEAPILSDQSSGWGHSYAQEEPAEAAAVATESEPTAAVVTEPEPAAETAEEQSWWGEPEPAAVADELLVEEASTDDGSAHEDSGDGRFLESVFGELDSDSDSASGDGSDEEPTTETEESAEGEGGFGLLRRRGLGAAFRELADS